MLAVGGAAFAQTREASPLNPPVPKYPYWAAFFGIEGHCDVRFNVDEDGYVFGVLASCSSRMFCHEANRTVSEVRFSPKLIDGVPTVRFNVVYPLTFRLDGGVGPDADFSPLEPCEEVAVS